MDMLISAIRFLSLILTILIFVDILASYFLNPFHPIRERIHAIVGPMLAPIRRVLPTVGRLDFSPIVLLLIIRVVEEILIQILVTLS
jgi:YggT family protein